MVYLLSSSWATSGAAKWRAARQIPSPAATAIIAVVWSTSDFKMMSEEAFDIENSTDIDSSYDMQQREKQDGKQEQARRVERVSALSAFNECDDS